MCALAQDTFDLAARHHGITAAGTNRPDEATSDPVAKGSPRAPEELRGPFECVEGREIAHELPSQVSLRAQLGIR
jgi:hypothetical protein